MIMGNAEDMAEKKINELELDVIEASESGFPKRVHMDLSDLGELMQDHKSEALQELKEGLKDLPSTEIEVLRREESEDGSFSGNRENTVVVELQDVIEIIEDIKNE